MTTCLNMKDDLNRSYNGGGVVYVLKSVRYLGYPYSIHDVTTYGPAP